MNWFLISYNKSVKTEQLKTNNIIESHDWYSHQVYYYAKFILTNEKCDIEIVSSVGIAYEADFVSNLFIVIACIEQNIKHIRRNDIPCHATVRQKYDCAQRTSGRKSEVSFEFQNKKDE